MSGERPHQENWSVYTEDELRPMSVLQESVRESKPERSSERVHPAREAPLLREADDRPAA